MISAAALGVAARTSATKSAIVKSISWPTAETIGIADSKIARATTSSLNAHKSSSEPPPRVIKIKSRFVELLNVELESISIELVTIQQFNRLRNFLRRALPLHAARREDDFQTRIPPLHDVQHVADRRARRRRHEADALRIFRQRTFPFRREETFRRELQLEFFERDLQRAHAAQFDLPHDQLILPAHLIDRDIALQEDLLPVRQQRARLAGGVAKTHAAQLRARVLEREINVAGRLRAQIGDLAA